jgi:glycosyltransferase involved in cell wall biosynthesis
MRLVFAHDHRFSRGPAGEIYSAGTFPARVWERFLDHFDEVSVIARDGGPMPDNVRLTRADRDGVTFQFFPSLASVRHLVLPSGDLEQRMRSAVMSADAVVARLPSEIGLLAVKHARRLGKPYAVEVVGCAWDSYRTGGARGSRLYAPLAYMRMRAAISNAPLALYATSSWLQRRYPNGGHTGIASNVALEPMNDTECASREARLLALAAGEPPVLGTIGTLRVRYKGIQTVLEALARLRSSGLDLKYRILGPGSAEPWQRLADDLGVLDLVSFDGTRSAGAQVCEWLDGIDLYLQPSFTEGLPRGMIEAMSRGAACVGSTCGGIPELLPKDRLHEPGDVRVLAAIIRRLAEDPDAMAAASSLDRKTARQFDADRLKEQRRTFYARLKKQAEMHRSLA